MLEVAGFLGGSPGPGWPRLPHLAPDHCTHRPCGPGQLAERPVILAIDSTDTNADIASRDLLPAYSTPSSSTLHAALRSAAPTEYSAEATIALWSAPCRGRTNNRRQAAHCGQRAWGGARSVDDGWWLQEDSTPLWQPILVSRRLIGVTSYLTEVSDLCHDRCPTHDLALETGTYLSWATSGSCNGTHYA